MNTLPSKTDVSKSRFFLVVGTGHCGTQWISRILHRPNYGVVCYHEEKLKWISLNWKDSLKYELEKGIDSFFNDYFSFINSEMRKNSAVGDSNSWTMIMIPDVATKQKVHQIIYLVRNGIQAVHSSFYHNLDLPYDDFLFTTYFRQYWEIIGCPWNDWNKYTKWASWCLWWRVNQDMPLWLSNHLETTEILVYRFEDLLEDTYLLSELIKKLDPLAKPSHVELKKLQKIDVNRKIQGNRPPSVLWSKWSDEQRNIFKQICGSTMEKYGYEFPKKIQSKLDNICQKLGERRSINSREILEEFNLLSGHPWEETAQSEITNYYSCLYGVVQPEQPCKILEIGTAFGLSAATLLKACSNVELFISIDLGIYGKQMGFSHSNIEFARYHIHSWCCRNGVPLNRVRFYRANTQPLREGDDDRDGVGVPRWHQIPDLVRLLESYEFDVIFIDGKHTKDGLLNDLMTFWPFLRSGGLLICDDLHDEAIYKDIFPWAGDTIRSYESFLKSHSTDINDSFIWNFPRVPPEDYTGLRPFGLIRKETLSYPLPGHSCFEIYDSQDAIEINRARQDHLASMGLDLANKTVLEVGSGVGRHTAFFEKLGCSILSTDARRQNVEEHCRSYPHRRVEVADLSIPGSHDSFGKFEIVYCYGTLYHLSNPSLCIRELSRSCRSLLLLETCVSHKDNGKINIVDEDSNNPNQSFEGIGCRPGRDWVMAELSKYFPYVYTTVYQPNHPDFPLNWPATNLNRLARAVFVASTQQLNIPALSTELLGVQELIKPALGVFTEVVNQDVPIASNKIKDYIVISPDNGKMNLPPGITRVWIDVGAYEGKEALGPLREANDLAVIALEPLVKKWERLKKIHPLMFALPMAVSNLEGFAIFHHTENDASSSLRSFNPVGLENWKDKNGLDVIEEFIVPTIRLERIIDLIPLERVEFLKIDAQGHDLDVVKSAGSKLEKIDTIKLEVAVTPVQLYNGGATKDEITSYMTEHGFGLINVESQTNGQEENLTFRTLQSKEKMVLKRKGTNEHTMVKSDFFVKRIKESIKRIPILGFLIWWAYMILKAPSKISELFDKYEELKKYK